MKHFLKILDHSREELEHVLDVAVRLKGRMKAGIPDILMAGKSLGMYFEKPSLRTRVSLEVAMTSMGGTAISMDTGETRLGTREAIRDQARVMSRFVDLISIRTFEHEIVEEMARWSSVPVINALSDYSHPTQAMADILTMREHLGDLSGKTLAFVGDGNNVAVSLSALCGRLGIGFVLGCPKGYELGDDFVKTLHKECPKAKFRMTNAPADAVKDASAVYTDVWASMGQESEAAERKKILAPYQINAALMSKAKAGAVVLHCLPAHRGEEITDEVIDSKASVVFDEAENRMHINRALYAVLLNRA